MILSQDYFRQKKPGPRRYSGPKDGFQKFNDNNYSVIIKRKRSHRHWMSLYPHRHEFSSSKILKLLAMEKENIQKTVSLSKSLHSAGDFTLGWFATRLCLQPNVLISGQLNKQVYINVDIFICNFFTLDLGYPLSWNTRWSESIQNLKSEKKK